jgi:Protein of unknown function (DUF1559)
VFDPNTRQYGNGPFGINAKLTLSSVSDGTSNTIGFSEVKAYQPALLTPTGQNVPPPATPTEVATYGGAFAPTGAIRNG